MASKRSAHKPEPQTNFVKTYMGVKLDSHTCHKLLVQPFYSNYSRDQLHYVIDAAQKGRKLPTKIGLKRMIKKNQERKLQKQCTYSIPSLNPKSPQQICMKALRSSFRNNLEKIHKQKRIEKPGKSQKQLRRKQKQKERRKQLCKLVRRYREILEPYFGDRLRPATYGSRCPKVSRKQIIDYLTNPTVKIQKIVSQKIIKRVIQNKQNIDQNRKENEVISLLKNVDLNIPRQDITINRQNDKKKDYQRLATILLQNSDSQYENYSEQQKPSVPIFDDENFPSLLNQTKI